LLPAHCNCHRPRILPRKRGHLRWSATFSPPAHSSLGGFLEKSAKPRYPEQAIREEIKGDVILQVEVDETGRVVRSLAIEGDPLLVAASVEALKDFHFRPYLLNGAPLSVESQMGFRFVLKGKGDKATGNAAYTSDVPFRPEFRTGAVDEKGI
jgi:TonB family protein